jgi:hypothetical protein
MHHQLQMDIWGRVGVECNIRIFKPQTSDVYKCNVWLWVRRYNM